MADNKIQIKRSTLNATIPALANGELAFTSNGNGLWIGKPDGSGNMRIGGFMDPGVLTANQALVANATSGIDKVIVANLVPTVVWANGAAGTAGQLLTSNSTGVYWNTPAPSVVGSDTQVQFNDGGSLGADAGLTFNKTTDTLSTNSVLATSSVNAASHTVGTSFIANSTAIVGTGYANVTTSVNSALLTVGTSFIANSLGVYHTGTMNAASHTVGALFTANSTLVNAAAINITGQVNTATLYATTSANIASAVQANATGVYTTGVVNAASHTSGAIGTGTGGTVQNTTVMFVGNNTINTVITSAGLTINGTATIANSSGVYTTGVVNSASHTAGAIGTGTGGTVQNTTVMFVGNNTINAVINSTALSIGGNPIANSTGANNAFNLGGVAASGYQTTSGLAANVATLTANNATNLGGVAAAAYVQNTDSRTLSGNLNFTGANVTFGGANLTVTGTNTFFSSNVNIGGTNAAITANLTLTGASVTGTSTDLTMRNGTFSGNLVVQGSVVTVNTAQLSVNDNIIQLSYNQTTTDTVDSGFFSPAGNSTAIWYSGIARIAASSTNTAPVFRVFASNTNPNTGATIDTSANTRTGFIQAYLAPYGIGGALVSNATNITLTANSTVAVSITANSLSLSTPLSGTNGGTGKSTMTNNAILVGNSTNGYNELTLGTSGNVLQSNGTALVYDTLDGGTF